MIPERIYISFDDPAGRYVGLYVASEMKLLETDIEYIRAPQWVSVEDRLPDNGQSVWVYSEKRVKEATYYKTPSVDGFTCGNGWLKVELWHPFFIPAPPKA